jgi:hypothetical protein
VEGPTPVGELFAAPSIHQMKRLRPRMEMFKLARESSPKETHSDDDRCFIEAMRTTCYIDLKENELLGKTFWIEALEFQDTKRDGIAPPSFED